MKKGGAVIVAALALAGCGSGATSSPSATATTAATPTAKPVVTKAAYVAAVRPPFQKLIGDISVNGAACGADIPASTCRAWLVAESNDASKVTAAQGTVVPASGSDVAALDAQISHDVAALQTLTGHAIQALDAGNTAEAHADITALSEGLSVYDIDVQALV